MRAEQDNFTHKKSFVVLFFFIIANCVCLTRITNLTLGHKDKGIQNNRSNVSIFLERLDIVDRNDVILATNLSTYSLYVDPKMIIEHQKTAHELQRALENKIPYNKILAAITTKNKRFVWVKRHLPPKYFAKINSLGRPGIFFIKEERRVYPQDRLLSHVLGHVNTEHNGVSGIENYFNERLMGRNKDAEPLQLSIDIRAQNALRQELSRQIEQYSASGGAAIIMEVNTGEVLAIVSLPDYNPNNLNNVSENAFFQRATLGVYEIGSIFKTFITAMALEENLITLDETIDISAPIKIGSNHYTKDLIPINGRADLETIFKKSSNIGMAKIGLRLGSQKIKHYLKLFGFYEPTKIELPEKSMPLHPKRWSDAEVATISYGYGVAATIVHIAEAMAAVSNGGEMVHATLLKTDNPKRQRVISKHTSDIIRKLLYKTVENGGTGHRAAVPGYCVGGKTGTSDKIVGGKYDKNTSMTSFAAVFPIYDPKYVIVAMIESPKIAKGRVTGGLVAAPVVGNVIKRLNAIFGLPPDDQRCKLYE